jgi:hypothetical protein
LILSNARDIIEAEHCYFATSKKFKIETGEKYEARIRFLNLQGYAI